jgi:hypothetical protein
MPYERMMWCRHHWSEVQRNHTLGALATGRAFKGNLSSRETQDALYGFTILELRCDHCGDAKSKQLTGFLPKTPANAGAQ